MGSLPNLSIIKGENRPFIRKKLYKIFENVASEVSSDRIAVIYEGKLNHSVNNHHATFLPVLINLSQVMLRRIRGYS